MTPDDLKPLVSDVVDKADELRDAINAERLAKVELLLQVLSVIEPARAALSSHIGGVGRGMLVAQRADASLVLLEDGCLRMIERESASTHKPVEGALLAVGEWKWPVEEIIENIAEKLQQYADGAAEKIARKAWLHAQRLQALALLAKP